MKRLRSKIEWGTISQDLIYLVIAVIMLGWLVKYGCNREVIYLVY